MLRHAQKDPWGNHRGFEGSGPGLPLGDGPGLVSAKVGEGLGVPRRGVTGRVACLAMV